MSQAEFKGTILLQKTLDFLGSEDYRFLQLQGGTRCFAPETLVLTPNGPLPIKDISKGDSVWAINDKGERVSRVVLDTFVQKAGHSCNTTITFVFSDGSYLESSETHEINYNGTYLRANDIARRVVENGAMCRWEIQGVKSRSFSYDELQELRKDTHNEASPIAPLRVYEDNDLLGGEQETKVKADTPISSKGVYTEPRQQATGSSHKPQAFGQQSVEPNVGDAQGKHWLLRGGWSANGEQWGKERNVTADSRGGRRYSESIQALHSNGEGLGEGVWGDNGLREGYASRKDLEQYSIDRLGIVEVVFGETESDLYDLSVDEWENYLVTEDGILVHNSSKTYSVLQAIVVFAKMLQHELAPSESFAISIIRKRMPSLKGTAMRDFFEILHKYGWYSENDHNKTENEYHFGSVLIEFLSLDDPQKIRGRKRDIAWLNEANELSWEDFKQINLRTKKKVILDYNPSEEYHWIYDNIEPRKETMFVKSTYRDNPFLTPEIIKEIEWLKETDENAWRIYGEGERGSSGANIYPIFQVIEHWPEDGEEVYGLDFGHNVESALIGAKVIEDEEGGRNLYLRLLMYEKKLTTQDIISRLDQFLGKAWEPIYADSSSPDRIDAIHREGFNIKGADKRNYSVKDGIDFVKQHRIHVLADSEDLIREMRGYKWKQDAQERILDEPVKFRDHAMDAVRYAVYTHFSNPVTWLMVE